MAVLFLKQHQGQEDNDSQPVDVVGDDGTVSGGVLPSQQGVEDIPTVICFRVTAVDVPDTLVDVVGTRAGTVFGSVTTSLLVETVGLQVPDTSGEQTCSNQIKDGSGDTKENLQ